jgi:hypothetical protein
VVAVATANGCNAFDAADSGDVNVAALEGCVCCASTGVGNGNAHDKLKTKNNPTKNR